LLAQYAYHLSEDNNQTSGDCASCKKTLKCLRKESPIKIDQINYDGSGTREWLIEDWNELSAYLQHVESICPESRPELEFVMFVKGSNVCPLPFFTPLSLSLYRLYNACGENHLPFPGAVIDQSAIYIQAAGILSAERNCFLKAMQKNG
jgi:hypothetical protein